MAIELYIKAALQYKLLSQPCETGCKADKDQDTRYKAKSNSRTQCQRPDLSSSASTHRAAKLAADTYDERPSPCILVVLGTGTLKWGMHFRDKTATKLRRAFAAGSSASVNVHVRPNKGEPGQPFLESGNGHCCDDNGGGPWIIELICRMVH